MSGPDPADSKGNFELMNRRVTHHRSISQLIINIESSGHVSASADMGIVNPSADATDDTIAHDSGHASPSGAVQTSSLAATKTIVSSTPNHHHQHHHHQHQYHNRPPYPITTTPADTSLAFTTTRPLSTPGASASEDDDGDVSGCFSYGATSPDSEYDEALAFPDSVTILSLGGERPILVERKPGDTDSGQQPHDAGGLQPAIPFQALYRAPVKFKSIQRKVFIPGAEIHVEIVDHERSITAHLLNPNLYTIRLSHGPFQWEIKKRYKHISALHHALLVFRTSLNFPFPTRSHKERRQSFRNTYAGGAQMVASSTSLETGMASVTMKSEPANETVQTAAAADAPDASANNVTNAKGPMKKKPRRKGALPRFPNRPESLVPVESLPERIRALENYLNAMLNIRLYRNHHETVNFLEVSQLSFVAGLGAAGKEAMIMKRTGFTRPGQSGCNCMGCFHGACCVQCNLFFSGRWRTRWFFVRETCFGYLSPKDGSVRCVVLFDQGFDVSTGVYSTGMRNGLQVVTACREMVVKSWTRRKAKEWVRFLKEVAHGSARDFTCANPHGSFAPVRASTLAAWFVDGASYMSAVADAMEAAREEIYIADWWLSPEIHMKRPARDGDYWRLDQILKRKAEQGVRIFLLLYKEVELALGINSYYSKQRLVDLHENVRVFRHPDHARMGVFFWAHHEKIVAVDQTYAFVGGIDLCYGRWDDYQHRLTDLGSLTASASIKRGAAGQWTLPDVAPLAAKVRLDEPDTMLRTAATPPQPRRTLPVLEPGDRLLIASPMASTGPEMPLSENTKRNTPEMERKNMLGKIKDNMRERGKEFMARISTADGGPAADEATAHDQQPQEVRSPAVADIVDPVPFQTAILDNRDGQAKYWIGKDYVNFIIKDLTNLDAPYTDSVDRAVTPRLPWHDVGAMVAGASARDVARHFIQRWNAVKLEKARENVSYPYLFPKSYTDIATDDLAAILPDVRAHRVTCQVLRSVASWSCGFVEQDTVEQSIHDAYVQTITKAQHYVYIENQFFISMDSMPGGAAQIKNQIANALVRRIVRAHRERQTFRVYVVMPLLPAFEGDVGGTTGTALRAITHWNYASICRGKQSLVERLRAAGVDAVGEYISFHSVRTSEVQLGQPVTELIYVHSKLLIADDRVVICGSANINDRSMIGKRDSEIAVLLTDEVFERGSMNGQPYPTGAYAGQLRRFLFREHLGMVEVGGEQRAQVRDPVINSFWNGIWRRTSERNTHIFDAVFKCVPTNAVTSFAELKKWQEEPSMARTDAQRAINEMKRIQGNLVDMPFDFLWREVLTPPGTTKEGLIPTSVWT